MMNLDFKVRESNRKFYNTVADIYETIDGRRNTVLEHWLESELKMLSDTTKGGVLLDLGCGTGVILRNANRFFKYSYGIDISKEMLKKVNSNKGICADCSFIPFKDESIDVVVCFSVLHHIYDPENILKEVYRVLKKGGLFYIDHDIDMTFVKRFFFFIKIYRSIFNRAKKYMRLKNDITEELYHLSEIHSNGIDSEVMLDKLMSLGFYKKEVFYHWFGLNSFTNKIFKYHKFKRGFAPLTHIVVKK